jgi:membrane-associated protein
MELWQQIKEIALALFDSHKLMETLGKPEYVLAGFIMLNLIVFTETGLLIGFFLPGDSLLVTTGLVFYNLIHVQGLSGWLLPLLLITLTISAIVGDSVGYAIGYRSGPKIFNREQSFFFRKNHLLAAQQYYEKHGGFTIIVARFMPILRTFAPVVAGVGKMNYRKFLFYNVVGGIGWVFSMVLLGFALTPVLQKPLQGVFGPAFELQKHIDKLIIIVVLASIAPMLLKLLRTWIIKRKKGDAVQVL